MSEKPVRWGIISTANIAQKALIPAIHSAGNASLAFLGSHHASRAERLAAEYDFQLLSSYDAVIESDVDAIYNPLPNGMHGEWSIRALEAGKHVLCEKPLSLNPSEAIRMIDASRRTGRLLSEAFMYRFHPQIDLARRWLKEGRAGSLRLIRTCFSFNARPDPANPRFQIDQGPGALLDVGCYCINASRLFSGGPPEAVSSWATFDSGSHGDRSTTGILEYRDHAALFDCSFEATSRGQIELIGDLGVIELPRPWLPGSQEGLVLFRTPSGVQEETTAPANHYQLMVEDFSRAIQTGGAPRWTAEDALENMRVIEAARISSREGRRVLLSDIPGRPAHGPAQLF